MRNLILVSSPAPQRIERSQPTTKRSAATAGLDNIRGANVALPPPPRPPPPLAPALPALNNPQVAGDNAVDDAMEIDEEPEEEEEIEFEVEVPEPQNPDDDGQNLGPGPLQKKRRVVRKITVRQVFVEIIPDSRNAICILGCLAPDAVSRKTYAAPTNGHITKHVKANHPLLWSNFCDCKNNAASFRVLQETIVNL